MLFGTIAALAHGAVLPASMFVFGDMINLFISHNITAEITVALLNYTVLPNEVDPNCSALNLFLSTSGAPAYPQFQCLSTGDFLFLLHRYIYAFVGH